MMSELAEVVNSFRRNHMKDNTRPEEYATLYATALCCARIRMSLYIHSTLYAAVILLLFVINILATPQVLWVKWPFPGWGFALFFHWFFIVKMLKLYGVIKSKEIARDLALKKS